MKKKKNTSRNEANKCKDIVYSSAYTVGTYLVTVALIIVGIVWEVCGVKTENNRYRIGMEYIILIGGFIIITYVIYRFRRSIEKVFQNVEDEMNLTIAERTSKCSRAEVQSLMLSSKANTEVTIEIKKDKNEEIDNTVNAVAENYWVVEIAGRLGYLSPIVCIITWLIALSEISTCGRIGFGVVIIILSWIVFVTKKERID
ncbi:MAG: hypothetical protein R3Y24_16160 [Eubacteriales bacterium]